MFTGLSAFPITPFRNEEIDYLGFTALLNRLVEAKVDSICAMGSTGLYPYLTKDERHLVTKTAVEHAAGIPVMAGIGALRTYDVLQSAEAVQQAGANAVLLAPMSYHRLSDEEVYALYERVTASLSVPLCIYENPGATNFTFSDTLIHEVAKLPNVAAVKIPGMPFETELGEQRLAQLRQLVPEHVAIGVSGDKFGAAGMAAGCDLWLSVLGGLFPNTVKAIMAAAHEQSREQAMLANPELLDMWELFANNRGGMRVMATAANILGYTDAKCLPHPLKLLEKDDRAQLETMIKQLNLA